MDYSCLRVCELVRTALTARWAIKVPVVPAVPAVLAGTVVPAVSAAVEVVAP